MTRRVFIGSSNIGDGAGPPAVGQQVRQPARRPPQHREGQRRRTRCRGMQRPARSSSISRASRISSRAYLPYRRLTGITSDTNRYAEPAGSRTTPSHHQIDLNYTQNVPDEPRPELQLGWTSSTSSNTQTGYNYETRIAHRSGIHQRERMLRLPERPAIDRSPNSISRCRATRRSSRRAPTFVACGLGGQGPVARSRSTRRAAIS